MGEPDLDFSQAIASLRLLGADRFDPIGLHYLEVLARRRSVQRDRVKCILEDKLKQALDDFDQRFQLSQCNTKGAISLSRVGKHESLRELTRHMADHSTEYSDRISPENVDSRAELKSVRQFRNTWSKLSANKQVTQALDQAPKNAGPINSHMLVLRSLALMRELSPDYLNRFVSYVDTLLCLDQGDKKKQTTVKTAVVTKPRSTMQKRLTT